MKIAFLKVPALAPYYFDLIYDIQDGFYFHVSYCYFHTHTGAHTQTHTYFWSWMSGRRWMHWYIYKYFSEYPYWYISVLCNVTLVGEGFPVGLQACRHCSCNIGPFFHADLLKSFDFLDFQLPWQIFNWVDVHGLVRTVQNFFQTFFQCDEFYWRSAFQYQIQSTSVAFCNTLNQVRNDPTLFTQQCWWYGFVFSDLVFNFVFHCFSHMSSI